MFYACKLLLNIKIILYKTAHFKYDLLFKNTFKYIYFTKTKLKYRYSTRNL